MTQINDVLDIIAGRHSDPFSILGLHECEGKFIIRVFIPSADKIDVVDDKTGYKIVGLHPLENPDNIEGLEGYFEAIVPRRKNRFAYRLNIKQGDSSWVTDDPYRFGPKFGDIDEYLIGEGTHKQLWQVLGAHTTTHEGVWGTHFAVWAPNAKRVSVVGNFNVWDGRRHVMRKRGQTGVWEIFVPRISEGEAYKFEILAANGDLLPQKADPMGFGAEHPPKTASVVRELNDHEWNDQTWMSKRDALQKIDQPISIYEVNLGSWRRITEEFDRRLSYVELASELVNYAKAMGFTHIELMPISEFPFDPSWGYQPVGLFAPTIRHGTLEEFRGFVEACHNADVGLILDWVPGHFPEDEYGLANFDGTHLYEHADPKEGFHPDWKTCIFNFGRTQVSNYLISNAIYWLKEHHVDGLRVDAVASMLYRDYSREDGEWVPNKHGGNENLEAIDFLKQMNEAVYSEMPGIMTVAEESTAFPGVSTPTSDGGLGFGFKWNMGWMNDTLSYMSEDPIHRKFHHHKMTFGLQYAFSENFVLPLSHDEVVHGKGSMLNKMPGEGDDKFANLRAYYGYMWGHPGKKLLFMGCEFAQSREWNHDVSLDWHLLEYEPHKGVQALVRDLNNLYTSCPALYNQDCKAAGFEWIEENSDEESIFAWVRYGYEGAKPVLVVCNFTPVERTNRRIGVPQAGNWIEKLNTDSTYYGGQGRGNYGAIHSEQIASSGRPNSINLTIPPLSTLFFELE